MPAIAISGQLTPKDVKRLSSLTRSGTVGPTAVYYAGATASVISAGMALMAKAAFELAGFTPYWQWFLSALLAAMAGIVWYLIFTRWSYRHSHGRALETEVATEIELVDTGLVIRRGPVETRIQWDGIADVRDTRKHTLVTFVGADALIVPDSWFNGDKAALKTFQDRLKRAGN